MTRETVIKGKIVLKDLGNPKSIAAEAETVRKKKLGVLYGRVEGFTERKNADGEKFTGFSGSFRALPDDEKREITVSDTLFLPPGPFGMLATDVRKFEPGEFLEFAFIVNVIRDTNPQGYAWAINPLFKEETSIFAKLEERMRSVDSNILSLEHSSTKHVEADVVVLSEPVSAKKRGTGH